MFGRLTESVDNEGNQIKTGNPEAHTSCLLKSSSSGYKFTGKLDLIYVFFCLFFFEKSDLYGNRCDSYAIKFCLLQNIFMRTYIRCMGW